jgi:hypothetical protein
MSWETDMALDRAHFPPDRRFRVGLTHDDGRVTWVAEDDSDLMGTTGQIAASGSFEPRELPIDGGEWVQLARRHVRIPGVLALRWRKAEVTVEHDGASISVESLRGGVS